MTNSPRHRISKAVSWLTDVVARARAGDDSCMTWPWSRGSFGHGLAWYQSRLRKAHQVSWELFNGREFPGGMVGCHKCDNPPCCNPLHTFPGTQRDNVCDMRTKRRHVDPPHKPGSSNGNARLTEERVVLVRQDLAAGLSGGAIAKKHGVGTSTIHRIRHGLIWRHVA